MGAVGIIALFVILDILGFIIFTKIFDGRK